MNVQIDFDAVLTDLGDVIGQQRVTIARQAATIAALEHQLANVAAFVVANTAEVSSEVEEE